MSGKTVFRVAIQVVIALIAILGVVGCAPDAPVRQLVCPINPELTPDLQCTPYDGALKFDITKQKIVDMYTNPPNSFGIYKHYKVEDGKQFAVEYIRIDTAGAYPAPIDWVRTYPAQNVIWSTTSDLNNCSQAQKDLGFCFNSITGITLAGGEQATLNLNGELRFNTDVESLKDLYEVGGAQNLGSSLILFLNSRRGILQDKGITVAESVSQVGLDKTKIAFAEYLATWPHAKSVTMLSFDVRKLLPDGYEQVQKALMDANAQKMQIDGQTAVVSAKATQQAAELELQGAADEYQRQKMLKDAQAKSDSIKIICGAAPNSDCVGLFWVDKYGDKYQPYPTDNGMSVTPYTTAPIAPTIVVTP